MYLKDITRIIVLLYNLIKTIYKITFKINTHN
jgi:hypothetical protein